MTPQEKADNMLKALHMAKRLEGYHPLLMLGYDPATGAWHLLVHPGILPVLQDETRREAFALQVKALLDASAHPENVAILMPEDPDPNPGDLSELERMLDMDEGGEG